MTNYTGIRLVCGLSSENRVYYMTCQNNYLYYRYGQPMLAYFFYIHWFYQQPIDILWFLII